MTWGSLLASGLLAVGAMAAEPRPNILLVTADDLGMEIGCYGDEQARTPVFDRFAAEGVRFANAFVTQSSCSPSRASILTGLYPHQNGQVGLVTQRKDPATGEVVNHGFALRDDVALLPNVLADVGYRTGIIGKLHVWPEEKFRWDFDRRNLKPGIGAPAARDVRLVAHEAGKFFRENPEKPFFLYVNYFDPHGPFNKEAFQCEGIPESVKRPGEVPVPSFVGFVSAPLERQVAGYENSVSRLDTGFGLLLEALEKSGAGPTLILFVSDNGAPFPRAKVTVYPAGVHVPMLAQWRGVTKPGTVVELPVSTVDIFPTLVRVAGAELPSGLPGRSLLPLLEGKSPPDWPQFAFSEFTFHENGQYLPARAVTDTRYHLVKNLVHGRPHPAFPKAPLLEEETHLPPDAAARAAYDLWKDLPEVELYDTQNDPNALENLAERPEFHKVRDRLESALQQWRQETNDPLLDSKTLADLTKRADERNAQGLFWSGEPRQAP